MTKCKLNVKTLNEVMDSCLKCKVIKLKGMNTCQIGKDILNKAIETGKNFVPKETPKRTQDSVIAELKKGSFVTSPDDKIIIQHHSGMVSNSIDLILLNARRKERVYFAINNKIESWKWLKRINELSAREVTYKIDDQPEIPYEKSLPYKHRFC